MKLTPEAKKELGDILEVIQTEADIVKQDYEDNPSDMDSGSIVVVHEDSPLLKDEKEELSDIAYNVQPKTINEYGDDDWATPKKEKNEYNPNEARLLINKNNEAIMFTRKKITNGSKENSYLKHSFFYHI